MDLLSKLFGSPQPEHDFKALIENGAKIIDVRTPLEFQLGHITGSKNIPLDAIDKEVASIKSLNAPIILVCRSGNRASSAKNILERAGVTAYNAGAWQNLR